ncbi:hypothetical protein GDO81_024269 [Engystomops pustulosus]|uniref:Phospholipase A2 inhibitor and Ly6/PLAUR domain-containing protein-like n=1 Tax=Engystomops pustulosus TaxID=76066 RepID=A0AAV6Z3E3_ENGPU|nr:hypothetical protein GDO81_024269 [Engystomops pustulosus]
MTSMIVILSLHAALIVTGYGLSCTQCTSMTSPCSGERRTCPSDTLCGSSYSETVINGEKVTSFHRSCFTSFQCDIKTTITGKQEISRISNTCCRSDNCTPAVPELLPLTPEANGMVCPSCISVGSTWCKILDTTQCTGDEKMCIAQTTQRGSFKVAFRGCATKTLCDKGDNSETIGGVTTKTNLTCFNGGMSVQKVVLTPAIVCLVFLKFFF